MLIFLIDFDYYRYVTKSKYKFKLENYINKPIVLILFAISRFFDYITTAIALDLGFSEQRGNFLFYGLGNWILFWVIQLLVFFLILFLAYLMYKYLNKERYKWLKIIPIFAYWSLFTISWTAPINNGIRILFLTHFNAIIPFNLYLVLSVLVISILIVYTIIENRKEG